jgi:uncharacterized protein
MTALPQPEITNTSRPHWDALREGCLRFQRCSRCTHAWLPPRDACPVCLSPNPNWENSAGSGKVISFVIYHVAYSDAFKDRLPYNVSLIELDEGFRILSNIIECPDGSRIRIGDRVTLAIETDGELSLARFKLVQ